MEKNINSIKVSVVMPSLNVAAYIGKCMESVTGQSLKEIEIICVDAGSEDGTLEILQRYAGSDPRVRIISSDKKSYGYQMNLGMEAARGEYIGIVETDDYVETDMFECLYRCASENRLDYVKSDFRDFSETDNANGDSEEEPKYTKLLRDEKYYGEILNPSENPEIITETRSIANCCGIYKTEFIKANGIRHNETPGATYQDTGFFIMVNVLARRAMYMNRAFYWYRQDNPNSSTNKPDKAFAVLEEYEYIEDCIKDISPEIWEKFCCHINARRFRSARWMLKRVSDDIKPAYKSRMRNTFNDADRKGELDLSLLTEAQSRQLEKIMEGPKKKSIVKRAIRKLF